MSTTPTATPALPRLIFVIRHGEKPGPHDRGVTERGVHSIDSLIPRGWQRAGALASLFAPSSGPVRAGLAVPSALFTPKYGDPVSHRAYQTILPLAQKIGVTISSRHAVGHERGAVADVLGSGAESVLVCWEHDHIPDLAAALPLAPGTVVPARWPDDRFDVVWRFELDETGPRPVYRFTQLPQRLLAGDLDTVIPVAGRGRDGLAA